MYKGGQKLKRDQEEIEKDVSIFVEAIFMVAAIGVTFAALMIGAGLVYAIINF